MARLLAYLLLVHDDPAEALLHSSDPKGRHDVAFQIAGALVASQLAHALPLGSSTLSNGVHIHRVQILTLCITCTRRRNRCDLPFVFTAVVIATRLAQLVYEETLEDVATLLRRTCLPKAWLPRDAHGGRIGARQCAYGTTDTHNP